MIGGFGTTQVDLQNYYGPDIFFVKQSVTVVKQAVYLLLVCFALL